MTQKKNKVTFNFGGVHIEKMLTPKELEKEKKELLDEKILFSYTIHKEEKNG